MISDIRVNVLLRGHRKRRRLEKLIGPGAVGYLIDLWIATAVSRPDGVLAGWTPRDVADEVGWKEDPEQLLLALKDSGWIERREDGVVIVHDWTVHQGWATGSSDRSNRARMRALIKHHGEESAWRIARDKYGFDPSKYGYVLQHATSMQPACSQHATAENSSAAACAIAEQHQMPARAGVSDPYPSPPPSPSQKDSTKVLSGSAGRSKKTHFTKKATEYRDEIKNACKKVAALSNGSKSFNPYQWAQVWINKNGHPQAVIDSLEGLAQFWGELRGKPWPYADKIMQSKNGTYNERDETTKSEGYKKMLAELAKLIGTV